MSINLAIRVDDEDLEKLLRYIDAQEHLSVFGKQDLIHRAHSLLPQLDSEHYRAKSVAVTADVDGSPLFSAKPVQTFSQPCQRPRCGQEDQGS